MIGFGPELLDEESVRVVIDVVPVTGEIDMAAAVVVSGGNYNSIVEPISIRKTAINESVNDP